MAVIREVSKVIHYNMDISCKELEALLAAIDYRRTYMHHPDRDQYRAELVSLKTLITGALKHG